MADRRTRRGLLAASVATSLCLLAPACAGGGSSSSPTTAIALDGTPRYPDAEGVVVDIAADFSTITLDGDRTYGVRRDVQSFSSLDGSVQQLLQRKGQYVQVGLKGDTIRWIAGIAALVQTAGSAPVVYYSGNLADVRRGKAIFEDGTVLTLADGVAAPEGALQGRRDARPVDPQGHRALGGLMPSWVRTVLASVGAAAITLAIAYLVIATLRPEPATQVAKANSEAVTVDDAVQGGGGRRVAVRGYVFLDEGAGALLCSARTNQDPRACSGSSLRLVGLDANRLDLEQATDTRGGYDAWSTGTVVLLGTIDRGALTVQDVLGT